jgi:hypothetical protein
MLRKQLQGFLNRSFTHPISFPLKSRALFEKKIDEAMR